MVVDPRVTKSAMLADVHVAVKPRGDVALLNGVLRVLLDDGTVDLDALRDHVDGLDHLVAHLQSWTVERAAKESGVDADAVVALARPSAARERCVLAWTMGVNHSVQGTETVTLLNTLALLTGNVGRPGAAPFSITGQCNAMGTRETGFTASMPGYRPYDDVAARHELAARLGIAEDRLPVARGKAYPDIINGVVAGRIKGLWIIGTNPVVSYPNREVLELGLRGLEMLVVQDGFETPTTALADVVLPSAIWGEKDGTYTNSERRVSRVRAAVAPPGEARSDFDITLAMAERWGCRDELFAGWTGPATRSRSGGASRPAGRATTAASRGSASTRPAASSGRAPRGPTVPLGGTPQALHRPPLPHARTVERSCTLSSRRRSATRRGRSTRWS